MPATNRRSTEELTRIMRRVRSTDTAPEVRFRKALWSNGIRYRKYRKSLPGKPDVAIGSKKVAVFIDGDYWHGMQWRRRKLRCLEDQFKHTQNRDYWLKKIRRTMQRDCESSASLMAKGWTVLRFWESEIESDLDRCVEATLGAIDATPVENSRGFLPEKTFADFFAGIGLMRMGLESHGWNVKFSNDIDERKFEMYSDNFPDAHEHYDLGDIRSIEPCDFPNVTLATASFPCNDLSLAGSRKGLSGAQSSAFWEVIRILQGLGGRKPPLVILENVTGFLTSHGGKDFRAALGALNDLGYCVDAIVLDAAKFVPQSRRRLFVIATLEDLLNESVSGRAHGSYESELRPKALAEFIAGNPNIRWHLRDLPPIENRRPSLKKIIEKLPQSDPSWWSEARTEYLLNQMNDKHREKADRMIAGRKWTYGTIFRRIRQGKSMAEIRTDDLAGCLRTPRGGSARQILFQAGGGERRARLLTPTECARLMGADSYRIEVGSHQALFGFGDAVCVPVIEWIAQYYLNPLVSEMIRNRPLRAGNAGREFGIGMPQTNGVKYNSRKQDHSV